MSMHVDIWKMLLFILIRRTITKGNNYIKIILNIDHLQIRDIIVNLNCPWIVTYDDVAEIRELYNMYEGYNFDLVYGVANTGLNSEIMFLSNQKLAPSTNELEEANIKINFRKYT